MTAYQLARATAYAAGILWIRAISRGVLTMEGGTIRLSVSASDNTSIGKVGDQSA